MSRPACNLSERVEKGLAPESSKEADGRQRASGCVWSLLDDARATRRATGRLDSCPGDGDKEDVLEGPGSGNGAEAVQSHLRQAVGQAEGPIFYASLDQLVGRSRLIACQTD
jgi:hypothetical protein